MTSAVDAGAALVVAPPPGKPQTAVLALPPQAAATDLPALLQRLAERALALEAALARVLAELAEAEGPFRSRFAASSPMTWQLPPTVARPSSAAATAAAADATLPRSEDRRDATPPHTRAATTTAPSALSVAAGAPSTGKVVTFDRSAVGGTDHDEARGAAASDGRASASSAAAGASGGGSGIQGAAFVHARRAAVALTVRLIRALTRTILAAFACESQGALAILPLGLDPRELQHRHRILASGAFRVVKLRLLPASDRERRTL
jgi:hypothetical protein